MITTITFPPHFNTLTEGGKHKFARHVDAIAELVDNSIHACRDEPEKAIAVCIHLDGADKYLSVLDNGIGMDIEGITKFATYALSQSARGVPEADLRDTSCISKFGVGAKQAGFYLGDRINLLTKTATHTRVLSFEIDEAKQKQQADPYSGIAYSGVIPEFQSPSLTALVHKHIAAHSHYSIVTIKLHDRTASELALNGLPAQLEEIYHFHLHPEHRHPAPLAGADRMEIVYQYHRSAAISSEVSLSTLAESNVTKCFTIAANDQQKYKFQFQIPTSMRSATLCTVHGVALYLPCVDGKETNPILLSNKDERETFKVYWQHRMLPDCKILNLKEFRPKDTHHVSQDWERRVVVFLFFGREFQDIADSKLRLLVGSDTKWLNNNITGLIGTGTRTTFSEFLRTNYDSDQEIIFLQRDLAQLQQSIFKEVKYGSKTMISSVNNPILKWKWKKDTKKANANKGFCYGRLIDFKAQELLRMDVDRYVGGGVFRYQRLPLNTFQSKKVFEAPIELLDFANCTMSDGKKGEKEIDQYEDSLPASIEISINHHSFTTDWTAKKLEVTQWDETAELQIKLLDSSKPRHIVHCLPGYDPTAPMDGQYKVAVSYRYVQNDGKRIEDKLGPTQLRDGMFILPEFALNCTGDYLISLSVTFDDDEMLKKKDILIKVFSKDVETLAMGNNSSLIHGLACGDRYLPAFEVNLLDSAQHLVPYEGELPAQLTLQLNDGTDLPLKQPAKTMFLRKNHHGVCSFTDQDWEVDWDGFDCILAGHKPRILGNLQLILDGVPLKLPFSFPLRAGLPVKLCVVNEDLEELDGTLDVRVDEAMNKVLLISKDKYGNITRPKSSQKWTVSLDKNEAFESQIDSYNVPPDGMVKFGGARLRGKSPSVLSGEIKWTLSLHQKEKIQLAKQVRVLPSRKPAALQICYNGGELGVGPAVETNAHAGGRLEGLYFNVLTSAGNPVALSNYSRRTINYDWMSHNSRTGCKDRKRKFHKIDEDENSLEDLQLPTEVGEVSYMLELELDRFQLVRELKVTILPLPAKKWCFCAQPDLIARGITMNETWKHTLATKIIIVALDEFNNVTDTDSHPALSIGIGSDDSIAFQDCSVAVTKGILQSDTQCFTNQVDGTVIRHSQSDIDGHCFAGNWLGHLPSDISKIVIKVGGSLEGAELTLSVKLPGIEDPGSDDDTLCSDDESTLQINDSQLAEQNQRTSSNGVAVAKRSLPNASLAASSEAKDGIKLKDALHHPDPVIAAILRWHVMPYLQTVIVDSAAGLSITADVIDLQSMEALSPWTAPDDIKAANHPGHPQFLMDVLSPPAHLSALFQVLFGNAVFCDTIADAQQYLASLRAHAAGHNDSMLQTLIVYSRQEKMRLTFFGARQTNPVK